MKKIIPFLTILLLATGKVVSAQTAKDSAAANIIRTASNLASGNVRDVLASFFQVAYNDLSSDNKEFKFSSNLFAIKLKTNPLLNVDTSFVHQTFARNSNINFSLKLDSNYNFNGIKAGYKYALVNQRDYAISQSFNTIVLARTKDYMGAVKEIAREIDRIYPGDEEAVERLGEEMDKFFNDVTFKYRDLSVDGKKIIKKYFGSTAITTSDDWNPRADLSAIYNSVIEEFKKKLLWTVEANAATYTDGFVFSNVDLVTEATAGILPVGKRSNLEFYVKGNLSWADDTAAAGRNLGRQLVTSSFGFNFVARNKLDKPVFEFKAAGGFDQIFGGRYAGEKWNKFMFDGELRIRITNELWVPVTIRYEPKTGNVFGFLNVRCNFDLLNKVFGALKKSGWSLPKSVDGGQ